MFDIIQLNEKLLPELKDIARKLNIDNFDNLKKQDLVYKILDHQALNPEIDFKGLGIDIPRPEPAKKERVRKETVREPREPREPREKPEAKTVAPAEVKVPPPTEKISRP